MHYNHSNICIAFYKTKWWNTCTHNLWHGRAVSLLHWKIILSQWTRWQCMCTVISILFKRTSIFKWNLFWFWNEARILKMETTKTPHIIDLHWLQLCWASKVIWPLRMASTGMWQCWILDIVSILITRSKNHTIAEYTFEGSMFNVFNDYQYHLRYTLEQRCGKLVP